MGQKSFFSSPSSHLRKSLATFTARDGLQLHSLLDWKYKQGSDLMIRGGIDKDSYFTIHRVKSEVLQLPTNGLCLANKTHWKSPARSVMMNMGNL